MSPGEGEGGGGQVMDSTKILFFEFKAPCAKNKKESKPSQTQVKT